MKKMLLFIVLIGAISFAGFLPFDGTDVAKLHPVEVLAVNCKNGNFTIKTDTGIVGIGTNVDMAIRDLKLAAPGEIFLDTVNYILVGKECAHVASAFCNYLRPACQIYIFEGEGELGQIAKYLENHPSDATILSYRQGDALVTGIVIDGEGYRVVYQ